MLSKHNYWKWVCISHLKLWVRNYRHKKWGVKLTIWFLNIINQGIWVKWLSIEACNMMLKSSCWELQFYSLKLFNWISYKKIMIFLNYEIHVLIIWGFSLGSHRQYNHFKIISMEKFLMYHREEGDGFLVKFEPCECNELKTICSWSKFSFI
jgi:hypothetical protein